MSYAKDSTEWLKAESERILHEWGPLHRSGEDPERADKLYAQLQEMWDELTRRREQRNNIIWAIICTVLVMLALFGYGATST